MSDLKLYTVYNKIYCIPSPHTQAGGYIFVKGFNFRAASAVRVDGVLINDFVIQSPTVIKVLGTASSEVEVLTESFAEDAESTLAFGQTANRLRLTSNGLEVLKQRVIKALISDNLSDAFTSLGSGLDKLAGSEISSNVITDAISKIRQTEEALLSVERPDEPIESTLSRINILGAEEDSTYNARILIQIVNKAGQSTETEVSSD